MLVIGGAATQDLIIASPNNHSFCPPKCPSNKLLHRRRKKHQNQQVAPFRPPPLLLLLALALAQALVLVQVLLLLQLQGEVVDLRTPRPTQPPCRPLFICA